MLYDTTRDRQPDEDIDCYKQRSRCVISLIYYGISSIVSDILMHSFYFPLFGRIIPNLKFYLEGCLMNNQVVRI